MSGKPLLVHNTILVKIAKLVNAANKAFAETIGDNDQDDWDTLPEEKKVSSMEGVLFVLENPEATPETVHDNWMNSKKVAGYVYGEVKDPEKKTHPCIVPFDEMSPADQFKDVMFLNLVRLYEKTMLVRRTLRVSEM